VAWADERVGDVFWTRAVLVMEKTPFRLQRERIEDLARRSRFSRMAVDAGGIGMQLAEELTRTFGEGRVDSIHLGAPVQEDLAARLKSQFEDRRCRIPRDPIVRDDLHQPRKVLLPGGGVRLEVPRTGIGHADRFWAKALAGRAAMTGGECGPIREGSFAGRPCQAALVGASAREGGIRW
jgi:phage FluMu gp28-like protein